MANTYPCDGPDCVCPFDAIGGYDCRNYCGLGVEEEIERATISVQTEDGCCKVVVTDSNGNLLHEDYCYPCDLERMVDELSKDFNI